MLKTHITKYLITGKPIYRFGHAIAADKDLYIVKRLPVICLSLICIGLNGCADPTQITEALVKAEEALKGNSGERKEKLFGDRNQESDTNNDQLSKVKYDDSKLSDTQKQLLKKIVNSNPEEVILKDGSLCNEILFADTSEKLIKKLEESGYGQRFSFKVGVTAMPEGTPDNMMWRELWKVQTPKGILNYPMVFIEDGVGGAFFIGLQPYNDTNQNSLTQTTKEDTTPNFFNSIKPLLSKNTSKGRIRHTVLYFSASWCPPCQQFTPILIQWYKNIKARHPEMEIVFVSSDKSKEEFDNYAKKMPWAHLAFEHKDNPEIRGHAAGGIPFLMLINEKGTPLTEKKQVGEILPQIESFITGKDVSDTKIKTGVFN